MTGFYLQAWQTQALAPQYTFGWLPPVTVAGGQYIDGRVAIPMIYPGPIYVGLSARTISPAGIAAIVAEARTDGLLGGKSDFSGNPAPGSILAHVRLVVDGVTYDLTGQLPTNATVVATSPGTAVAFAAFWIRIGTDRYLARRELGESGPYQPADLAVLVTPPADATSRHRPQPGALAAGEHLRCIRNAARRLRQSMRRRVGLPTWRSYCRSSSPPNALTRFVDGDGRDGLAPGAGPPAGRVKPLRLIRLARVVPSPDATPDAVLFDGPNGALN